MSRPEYILCDKCGAEIPVFRAKEDSAKLTVNAPGEYRGCGGQRIDLCAECYQKFIDFMEEGDEN